MVTVGGARQWLAFTFMSGICSVLLIGCDQTPASSQHTSAAAQNSPNPVAFTPTSSRPSISYSTVRTDGTGRSFDEALQNALVLAIEEVNGARVSKTVNVASLVQDYHTQSNASGRYAASENASGHASMNVNAQRHQDGDSASLNAVANGSADESAGASGTYSSNQAAAGSFNSNASAITSSSSTSGAVRRFQVFAMRQDQGGWHVSINAEIPVYEASAAAKRLKIAVLPFRMNSSDRNNSKFEQTVRSMVIDALSQSGKVAVLDRDYSQEDEQELAQLQTEEFAKEEAAKLGNKLGADFIVVGTVLEAATTQDSVYMEAIGQRIYGATHSKAQLTFRLIEAATGVVQLSGTLDASRYVGSNLDAIAKEEAGDLSNRILESLYPLRIESIADGVFYLGRGGDSIHVGDEFRVIREGQPIIDSDTHEVLGYSEQELGKIVVTEVEAKLSKAEPAEGSNFQIADSRDLIARRVASGTITAEASPSAQTKASRPPHRKRSDVSGGPKEGTDY